MTFLELVSSFVSSERLLTPEAKVVVGLSGGADSSALLAVLCELGYECHAVHCHFGLRGSEADRDLNHSRQLAARFGVEFYSVYFDTYAYAKQNGVSLEMACRELRYDYFEKLCDQLGADVIAVGHHKEDNIETFFLNLLRGSGLHGLRAMLPRRGRIVRPLLSVSKSQILDFLRVRGIEYVEDSSNSSNDFRRNRLRNVVLPILEEQFPGSLDAVHESVKNLRRNEELYNALLPKRVNCLDGITETLLFEWLSPFGFNSAQCEQILTSTPGAQFMSDTHKLTLCKGNFYELDELQFRLERPRLNGRIYPRPKNFKPSKGVLYLDADSVNKSKGNWELRLRRAGDRIKPFGMITGTKLVNDILAEAGVSVSGRDRSYVLTLDGEILWVVGVRASAHYPVTESTKNIIEIYHEKERD
ncbi:MAG: tRNA lysidine(34) synthetase TilS [Bacteroidales bacterium]|nr:tRNA lysidine(34) synthetase TilS [Bacteroidales bacterium]